jgi:hypothetical protein
LAGRGTFTRVQVPPDAAGALAAVTTAMVATASTPAAIPRHTPGTDLLFIIDLAVQCILPAPHF